MIIHGYNGSAKMAEDLVKAGFLISFGEAIAREHSKIVEALAEGSGGNAVPGNR